MSEHLSEAWHADVAAALGAVPARPGAFSGRVRWTVGKAPGGDATFTWVWRDGVVTDNGNWILDVHGLAIVDPVAMERDLNQIPGVVSVGLFARRPADVVIVGGEPPVVL